MKSELCPIHTRDKSATHIFQNPACPICCPDKDNDEIRFGMYMACSECGNPILSEKNGFTSKNGEVICQRCGLEKVLTPREWSTMFSIISGVPSITTPDQCPSIKPFPLDGDYIVEFANPMGEKFCIVR